MKTTITIDSETYDGLIKKKMDASVKKGKPITWDEYFEEANLKEE